MSSLRERLAQMGETARAATPGPWEAEGSLVVAGEGYVVADCDSYDEEDVDAAEMDTAHIATFHPDVAAALVAVAVQAERGQRHFSTECGTDPDQGIFHAVMASRRDDMKAALNALAAALGVSR